MNKINCDQFLKKNNLWPNPKDERWKYFNFKGFESLVNKVEYNEFKPEIKFVDSDVVFKDQTVPHAPTDEILDGIKITDHEILISKMLKDKIDVSVLDSFSNKNQISKLDFVMTDLKSRGYAVQIKIKSQKDLKLSLIYSIETGLESLNPTVSIEATDSTFTIFEIDETKDVTHLNLYSKINLKNSSLNLISVYGSSLISDTKIINSEVHLQNESIYNHSLFLIKNKFIRYQQSIALDSEKSEAHLSAFNISDENSYSEVRTEVLHLKPKAVSRQLFKTIVSDEAQSVFNGRVFVDPQAQKTDSAQLCQGLILSPKAEINAKPELEIYADDVKASHGAAIGQLGKDQIFYLVSRGITPETAYQILAHAFAGEVVSKIQSLKLRKKCETIIKKSSGAIFQKLAESFGS